MGALWEGYVLMSTTLHPASNTLRDVGVSISRGSQTRPEYTMILIVRTPKAFLIHGNSHVEISISALVRCSGPSCVLALAAVFGASTDFADQGSRLQS